MRVRTNRKSNENFENLRTQKKNEENQVKAICQYDRHHFPFGSLSRCCVSPTALSVAISSPEDVSALNENSITVTGTVSVYPRGEVAVGEQRARLVPKVTVNDIGAELAQNGGFSANVELIEAAALLSNVEVRDCITAIYNPPTQTLTSIAVEPSSPADLAIGATEQFTATGNEIRGGIL